MKKFYALIMLSIAFNSGTLLCGEKGSDSPFKRGAISFGSIVLSGMMVSAGLKACHSFGAGNYIPTIQYTLFGGSTAYAAGCLLHDIDDPKTYKDYGALALGSIAAVTFFGTKVGSSLVGLER